MEKVGDIADKLKKVPYDQLPGVIEEYDADDRAGVQKALVQAKKRLAFYRGELERLENMKVFERKYSSQGFAAICGIDEAGRGPLAGPVVAAAVVLPAEAKLLYLNDSKQVSAKRREELYDQIMECALGVGTGIVSPERIDEINILQATYEAMRMAISSLGMEPDVLLVDALQIPGVSIKQEGIIKGDAKSVSIAAASIIAKVTRDRMMEAYAKEYPEYHFASNKGYGSKEHIAAIQEAGPCAIHRRTFIKNFM